MCFQCHLTLRSIFKISEKIMTCLSCCGNTDDSKSADEPVEPLCRRGDYPEKMMRVADTFSWSLFTLRA
jgi:hypothetical protein